jgi:hypothetical protein
VPSAAANPIITAAINAAIIAYSIAVSDRVSNMLRLQIAAILRNMMLSHDDRNHTALECKSGMTIGFAGLSFKRCLNIRQSGGAIGRLHHQN